MMATLDALTFFSTIALAVLGVITYYLSLRRNVHIFIVVGQTVFTWLTATLITITVSRIFLYAHMITSNEQRYINGAVFIGSVLGILWSVRRHGKTNK